MSATTPVVARRHAKGMRRNDCFISRALMVVSSVVLLNSGIHYGDDLSIVSVVKVGVPN